MAFVYVCYVCVAAAATFSGKNTRACMRFRSTQALHCWLVACTALIVPAVESCPSFTSSVEEGRAVCPGEELTHTCTIDGTGSSVTEWRMTPLPCVGSVVALLHSTLGDPPIECGPFSAQLTANDSNCYTSTLTVTASPELNGTVVRCENALGNVAGSATILLSKIMPSDSIDSIFLIILVAPPSPIPIPTQSPSTDTLTSTTIEWSVPGDSGADITSYTITYTSESVDVSATSALLTGLTPNVDYEANITASNCAGTSKPTAFSFRIQGTGERILYFRLIVTSALPPPDVITLTCTVPPALENFSDQSIFDCTGASINLSWKVHFFC